MNSLKNLFRLALIATAVASIAPIAMAQSGYKPEFRLSTNVNEAFPLGRGAQTWAKLVNERTQGRINVKWYPGSSLVGGETRVSSQRCVRARWISTWLL